MPPRQRLRLTYGRDERLKYLGHLDLLRTWERTLRRAALPIAYSQGFSPKPRIAIGAPLPVGITAEAELLDVFLAEPRGPAAAGAAVRAQLPPGLSLSEVREVSQGLPALQAAMRGAEYDVVAPTDGDAAGWRAAIARILARATIPVEEQRGKRTRRYDLRPLIERLDVVDVHDGRVRLRMRLRQDERGAGRPEAVLRALGAARPAERLHRVRLCIDEPSIARAAYHAAGRWAN